MAGSGSTEESAGWEPTATGAQRKRAPTVLQLVPALDHGGVERGAVDIARALTAAGGRALVASAGGRMESALARAGGELIRLDLGAGSPAAVWRNAGRIARIARAEGVDVIHARSRATAWAGLISARRVGARFVVTWHGARRENAPFQRALDRVMARGRPTIAVSEFVAALIRARHPGAEIVTIPRGVDLTQFDEAAVSAERTIALARRWGLSDDPRPVALLPARLTRWKGQAHFVDAADLLRARRGAEDFRFVMVGGDPQGAFGRELRARIAARGLDGCVLLAGPCDDMPAALKLASVVVSASIEPEAFGRAPIEAMAMGRPVVASDHGGARETVAPGCGWLYRPGDPAALAEAIDAALSMDASAAAHMAMAGRAQTARSFSLDRMAAATLAVYGAR